MLLEGTAPREGEEIRAQYAIANTLSRKVVTCKLTTLVRSGREHASVKKVMVRVGGGELAPYYCGLCCTDGHP